MEDRKRAEALARRLIGSPPSLADVEMTLIAFAEERRLERERCALIAQERGEYGIAARIRDAGPAEGEGARFAYQPDTGSVTSPPQGAPTASALRAEGTPLAAAPGPLREALREIVVEGGFLPNSADPEASRAKMREIARVALAAAPSAQPQEPDSWDGAVCECGKPVVYVLGRCIDHLDLAPPPTPQASETPAGDALRAEVERQRARADAAEREVEDWRQSSRDWKYRAEQAEATIATLREEVERLRDALSGLEPFLSPRARAALSPPQAGLAPNPQEPEGSSK